MAPRSKVNLTYMHFTFSPKSGPIRTQMAMRHDEPNLSEFIIIKKYWFLGKLISELASLPEAAKISFSEWTFLTNNFEPFNLNGHVFDKMLLVLGENAVYWSFYMNDPLGACIEGQGQLPLIYCSCCIQEKYLEIVKTVKMHIKERYLTADGAIDLYHTD